MSQLPFWESFVDGLISSFSPCVISSVPVYIFYAIGYSLEYLKNGKSHIGVFLRLLSVLGFSFMFILIGTVSGSIGQFLSTNKVLFARISGVAVIFFGLQLAGIIGITFSGAKTFAKQLFGPTGLFSALLFGNLFALNWSSCVTPALAAILVITVDSGSTVQGFILLLLYFLGMGILFVFFFLSINYFFKIIKKVRTDILQKIAGWGLILSGAYLIYNGGFNF